MRMNLRTLLVTFAGVVLTVAVPSKVWAQQVYAYSNYFMGTNAAGFDSEGATVALMTIPTGTYVVQARAVITPFDLDVQPAHCLLWFRPGQQDPPRVLDRVDLTLPSHNSGDVRNGLVVAFMGDVLTDYSLNDLGIFCAGYLMFAEQVKITATRITGGVIHVDPYELPDQTCPHCP